MPQSSPNFPHFDLRKGSGSIGPPQQFVFPFQPNGFRYDAPGGPRRPGHRNFYHGPPNFARNDSANFERPRMRGVILPSHAPPTPLSIQDSNSLQSEEFSQHISDAVKQEIPDGNLENPDIQATPKLDLITNSCTRLWRELDSTMQIRESMLTGMKEEIETLVRLSKAQKEVASKERAQAEAIKQEAARVCETARQEARTAKAEKEALERISTDISVQVAELKRIQHQLQGFWESMDVRLTEFKQQSQGQLKDVDVECEARLTLLKAEFRNHREASRELEHALQRVSRTSESNSSQSVEANTDELDGVILSKRMELLRSRREKAQETEDTKACIHEQMSLKRKMPDDGVNSSFDDLIPEKHRKKYKIPIETILQEDAPGLFEKLHEKDLLSGFVYGDFFEEFCGSSELEEDDFKDLEDVVQKLWGTPTGWQKLFHLTRQCQLAVNSKPSYCLACLVSLIEQTRALQQRDWPVEWGWCRQLRAFIFVFDKHNRIVLERPEYGYATYFFELVESLSSKWQVGRLIRVMSAPTVGRTALLENRPLEVGQDMTIEEAKVLEDYGWTPNTGLGSLLNFCDRVVHDVKDEDNTDWRQKIGKCLMDGYDHGRIAVRFIPPKLQKMLGIAKNTGDGTDVVNVSAILSDVDIKAESIP